MATHTEAPLAASNVQPSVLRVLVIGDAAGSKALSRALRSKPQRNTHHPVFLSKHEVSIDINRVSTPLEIWQASVESYAALTQLLLDVVFLVVDPSQDNCIESTQSKPYFDALFSKRHDMPIVIVGVAAGEVSADGQTRVKKWAEDSKQLSYLDWSIQAGSEPLLNAIQSTILNNTRREYLQTPGALYGALPLPIGEDWPTLSIAKAFRRTFEVYQDRPAIGERKYDENGEPMLQHRWTTYKEAGARVKNFGCGLRALGVPRRAFVGLCAENSASWIVTEVALQVQNMIGVLVHFTLPDEDVEHVVAQATLEAAVVGPHIAKAFAKAAVVHPTLKYIIIQPIQVGKTRTQYDMDALIKECQEIVPTTTKILTQAQVEAMGEPLPDTFAENESPDEMVVAAYTSGSTGKPKAVTMTAKLYRAQIIHNEPEPAAYLNYSPLSHTARYNVYNVLCGGGRVSLLSGDISHLLEQMQLVAAMVCVAVPRFWNVLYSEYSELVSLYRQHQPHKSRAQAEETAKGLVRSLLGSFCMAVVVGGAASTPAVYEWLHSLGFPTFETYGMTEVGAIASSGQINPGVEIKVLDVPEMGYTWQDKPFPRGELCVKTGLMFSGYLNNPEETKDSFTEDGFVRTGDIVEFIGAGFIRIVDRKKFIFKLAQGEYISPAKSEGVYSKSPLVANIMSYGNSSQTFPVAVVSPNKEALLSWASSHGIHNVSFEQLCQLPEIKSLLLREMRKCEQEAQLRNFEKVRNIYVTPEPFTADNGMLTSTHKLNRNGVIVRYKEQLNALYSGNAPEVEEPANAESAEAIALRQLKALVARALPNGQDLEMKDDASLASAGMDSLSALRLINTIQKTMNVAVPIASLYQPGMTLQSLAQAVSSQASISQSSSVTSALREGTAVTDVSPYYWFRELLPSYESVHAKIASIGNPAAAPAPPAPTPIFENKHGHILLTGVTGFLGLYLLKDLLDEFPQSIVHCVIRAASVEEATKRLVESIEFAHLDPELAPGKPKWARVKVILADLAKPQLGLPDAEWGELCDTIDSIYHCGAWVNLLFPYAALRDANVASTGHLLRMALTGKKNRKAFHFISTLSALSFSHPSPLDHPKASITKNSPLFGFEGYALTKRVCEVLIARTEELVPDLPIAVYRPGAVFGHSKTGHINIVAFIHKLLVGIIQSGAYPNDKEFGLSWAPVDFYSKTIVHISKNGGSMSSVRRYNIDNPSQKAALTGEALGTYANSFGYNLVAKDGATWARDLIKTMDEAPGTNVLEPVRQMLSEGVSSGGMAYDLSSTLTSLKTDPSDTTSPSIISCGPISEQHLHAVLAFCVEKGYFPAPRKH